MYVAVILGINFCNETGPIIRDLYSGQKAPALESILGRFDFVNFRCFSPLFCFIVQNHSETSVNRRPRQKEPSRVR